MAGYLWDGELFDGDFVCAACVGLVVLFRKSSAACGIGDTTLDAEVWNGRGCTIDASVSRLPRVVLLFTWMEGRTELKRMTHRESGILVGHTSYWRLEVTVARFGNPNLR